VTRQDSNESPEQAGGSALFRLVEARLREFCREPAAIFWVYVFPLIMMVALGVAFRNRPQEQTAVDVQAGPQSDFISSALLAHERFEVRVLDEATCKQRLRTGKTALVVQADSTSSYVYVYDPTRQDSVLARNAVDDVLQRAAGRTDAIATHNQELTEQGGRYIDFLVPGLIGMGLLGGGLWGVGFAIVDMRIRKLLKRFLATPMKRSHFLAAMMISRLLFMIPEMIFLLVFARLAFGVVNYGSYFSVAVLVVLGAFEFAGIGLLVASRAQTLETVSGLMNLVMLPMWIGSGIFFSVERFPDIVQPLLAILPLTPLIAALRAVMLEGASLLSIGPQIGIVSAWGTVTFLLALKWFRWS
jgi:ABC-type multidrug transport system permease subunit